MPPLPYHAYLDLDVINNDFSRSAPPLLKFEETRNAPFLGGDSSEYFCSIVRFSTQTGELAARVYSKDRPERAGPNQHCHL